MPQKKVKKITVTKKIDAPEQLLVLEEWSDALGPLRLVFDGEELRVDAMSDYLGTWYTAPVDKLYFDMPVFK